MTADRPDESPDRGGSGPLLVMLVAFAVLCAGSIGGAGYFLWRAVDKARERAADVQAEMEAAATVKAERDADEAHRQFERVARAVADGLAAPDRLADSYSPDGKPLLSWRVHLLPRLGHADLYRRFKLDEPWDGPHNRALFNTTPAVYYPQDPRLDWPPGRTNVRGFSYEGAVFEPLARFTVRDIPAGADNTLAIFDSADPVPWTRPDGLTWRPGEPGARFGGTTPGREWFLAATASGRVVRLPKSVPEDTLRQLFDRRHDARAVPLPTGLLD
jgi:hypothetical protein